jgi:thioredoxin 1
VGLAFGLWWLIGWTRSTWNSGASPVSKVGKLALIGLLAACIVAVAAQKVAQSSPTAAGTAMAPATTQTSGIPKLMDLGSTSCIPCKQMAPVLAELKKDYAGRFDVEFVDVGLKGNLPLAQEYGIRLIPTQIFFGKDGKELWRHEGFLGKDDILAKWEELGVRLAGGPVADSQPARTLDFEGLAPAKADSGLNTSTTPRK